MVKKLSKSVSEQFKSFKQLQKQLNVTFAGSLFYLILEQEMLFRKLYKGIKIEKKDTDLPIQIFFAMKPQTNNFFWPNIDVQFVHLSLVSLISRAIKDHRQSKTICILSNGLFFVIFDVIFFFRNLRSKRHHSDMEEFDECLPISKRINKLHLE